jgi:hypothetical protein
VKAVVGDGDIGDGVRATNQNGDTSVVSKVTGLVGGDEKALVDSNITNGCVCSLKINDRVIASFNVVMLVDYIAAGLSLFAISVPSRGVVDVVEVGILDRQPTFVMSEIDCVMDVGPKNKVAIINTATNDTSRSVIKGSAIGTPTNFDILDGIMRTIEMKTVVIVPYTTDAGVLENNIVSGDVNLPINIKI